MLILVIPDHIVPDPSYPTVLLQWHWAIQSIELILTLYSKEYLRWDESLHSCLSLHSVSSCLTHVHYSSRDLDSRSYWRLLLLWPENSLTSLQGVCLSNADENRYRLCIPANTKGMRLSNKCITSSPIKDRCLLITTDKNSQYHSSFNRKNKTFN